MNFFSDNFARAKTVTLTSVTDASAAVDGDKGTSVNAPSAMPRLRIDLGTAQVVDAVWAKAEQSFNLYAGASGSTLSSIASGISPTDGISYHEFTNTTAYRFYELRFSGSGTIYEAMLLETLFEVPDPGTIDEEPFFPVSVRANALRYDAVSRHGDLKNRLSCEWRQLPVSDTDALRGQWRGQEPVTVALDDDAPTERIWTVRMTQEATFEFSHSLTSLGRTVRLNFEEV